MNGQPGMAEPIRESGVGRRSTPVRRSAAGRVAPLPTGPGRPGPRPVRRAVRPVSGGRPGVAPRPQVRQVAGRVRADAALGQGLARGWRGLVLAGLASGVAMFGLGALADEMAMLRVPDATAPVVVGEYESLWQVAHRAAPSAEPGAVVRRIVELNGLESPAVEPGRVLISPIE